MNAGLRLLGNTVLPIAVIAGGVLGARAIVASRQEPPRVASEHTGVAVETATAEEVVFAPRVHAFGVVRAEREVTIQPEVTGRVTWLSDAVVDGGFVEAGAELFRVDSRDYALAVEAAQVAREQSRAALALERGLGEVAAIEWDAFSEQLGGDGDPSLALREPQARSAEAAVDAADNALRRARLQLDRTAVAAPFDAVVRSESLELGQLVSPATPAITLVGTDTYRVEVQVPMAQLDGIDVPGVNAATGSHAVVRQSVAGREVLFDGTVARLLPSVDASSRMARLVVEVADPTRRSSGGMPLLLDLWVEVDIDAGASRPAVRLPESQVRDGAYAWVATPDGTLSVRELDIAWSADDAVWLRAGIAPGEAVVTTHLETPVEGMALRVAPSAEAAESDAHE